MHPFLRHGTIDITHVPPELVADSVGIRFSEEMKRSFGLTRKDPQSITGDKMAYDILYVQCKNCAASIDFRERNMEDIDRVYMPQNCPVVLGASLDKTTTECPYCGSPNKLRIGTFVMVE